MPTAFGSREQLLANYNDVPQNLDAGHRGLQRHPHGLYCRAGALRAEAVGIYRLTMKAVDADGLRLAGEQLLANYNDVPQNLMQAIVDSNATRMDFIAEAEPDDEGSADGLRLARAAETITMPQNLMHLPPDDEGGSADGLRLRRPSGIYRLTMKANYNDVPAENL